MLRTNQPFEFNMPQRVATTTWDIIIDTQELSKIASECIRLDIEPEFLQKEPGFPKFCGKSGARVDIYEPKPKIVLPTPVDPIVFTFPNGKKLTLSKSFIMHHSITIRNISDRGMLEETVNMTFVTRKSLKLAMQILYNPGVMNALNVHLFRVGVLENLLVAVDVLDMRNLKDLISIALPNYLNFYFQVVKFYKSLLMNTHKHNMYLIDNTSRHTQESIEEAKLKLQSEPGTFAMIQVNHLIVILDKFSYFSIINKVLKLGREDIVKVIEVRDPDMMNIMMSLKPQTYMAMIKIQEAYIANINETAGLGGLVKSMKRQIGF